MKRFRTDYIAIGFALLSGLVLGLLSGLIETVAVTDPEGTFVRWCTGLSAKMFSVSAVLLLLGAFQWHRVKFSGRLQKLEQEIALLRASAIR